MAHKDLGRVLGLSAFEDWETRNPGGTWEEYQKSLKGIDGEAGPPGADGKSAYELWIEQGNKGTIEEFFNSFKGVGIVDKRLIGKNDNGDYIYRDVYSDGSESPEYLSPRGPRGYTGGTVGGEDPPPPTGVPYGTIVEHGGLNVPSGWALCNGGTLAVGKYPHLIGELPHTAEPINSKYQFTDNVNFESGIGSNGDNIWSGRIYCGGMLFSSTFYRNHSNQSRGTLNGGYWSSIMTTRYESDWNRIIAVETVIKSGSDPVFGYLCDLKTVDTKKYFYPIAIAIDGLNHEYGGMLPTIDGTPGSERSYNINKHPDIYFNLEYKDEHGNWMLGCQLHNKTDFVKSIVLNEMYIASIPNKFKTNEIRLSIDPKSTPHYPNGPYYHLGRFHTYLDDIPNRDMTVIKLPNEKDNQGRYKIVYIGQPLETLEPGMYSYSRDNTLNGEVPFSLAIENKLPIYSEGITMSEPKETKMGYINKYNNELDTWELVKTHENQKGYYYDDLGDLKYIPKSNNYSSWDIINHTWNESQELKEQEKQRLTDELIALEIKKDKMVDLNLETNSIMEQIELINKEIENINR